MRVVFYDIAAKLRHGNTEPAESARGAARRGPTWSRCTCPETPQTHGLMGAGSIARHEPGASCSTPPRQGRGPRRARGGAAHGHLAGAAVDVFPAEPAQRERFVSPLQGLERHAHAARGRATEEAQERIGAEVARKLVDYIGQGQTSRRQLPAGPLPPHAGRRTASCTCTGTCPACSRQPQRGLLGPALNIDAQELQTRGEVGYVVTDVDTASSDEALAAVLRVPATIRARVLF